MSLDALFVFRLRSPCPRRAMARARIAPKGLEQRA
jgi:hypothetical protein